MSRDRRDDKSEAADVAGSIFRSFCGGFFGCLGVGVAVVVVIILIVVAAATCADDDDPFDYIPPRSPAQQLVVVGSAWQAAHDLTLPA